MKDKRNENTITHCAAPSLLEMGKRRKNMTKRNNVGMINGRYRSREVSVTRNNFADLFNNRCNVPRSIYLTCASASRSRNFPRESPIKRVVADNCFNKIALRAIPSSRVLNANFKRMSNLLFKRRSKMRRGVDVQSVVYFQIVSSCHAVIFTIGLRDRRSKSVPRKTVVFSLVFPSAIRPAVLVYCALYVKI